MAGGKLSAAPGQATNVDRTPRPLPAPLAGMRVKLRVKARNARYSRAQGEATSQSMIDEAARILNVSTSSVPPPLSRWIMNTPTRSFFGSIHPSVPKAPPCP